MKGAAGGDHVVHQHHRCALQALRAMEGVGHVCPTGLSVGHGNLGLAIPKTRFASPAQQQELSQGTTTSN